MGRINNDAAFFMSYVRGEDRGQAALLPAAIEDYVAAKAPVLVIDAFVVLVMEENDLSSTNHHLVAEAMARAEAGRPYTPDEIFLVSTIRPNPWWVTCLRPDGANYYDDGERFHELDPVNIVRIGMIIGRWPA